MKRLGSLLISIVLIVLLFACTKEGRDSSYGNDNECIKTVSSFGIISEKYFYDYTGKIVEINSVYSYKRFIYGKNGRLAKVEEALDVSTLVSSAHFSYHKNKELMTSKNSTINRYRLYHYDKNGRLSKIENYSNETGKKFEYRSMTTFEYEGVYVVKENLHDPKGKITSFHTYVYDEYGNVANQKYYACMDNSEPELTIETSYQHDRFKNPYRIFSISESPYGGLWVNTNNIIEINSTMYKADIARISKYSTSKTAYQYDENGYPVKVDQGDGFNIEYAY